MKLSKEVRKVELRLKRLGKEGWSEHLPETSPEKAAQWLGEMIRKHGPEEEASYKVTTKINKGYGRNKEDGTTSIMDWSGPLNYCPAWRVIEAT